MSLLLVLLFMGGWAQADTRTEGILFEKKGRLYITEDPTKVLPTYAVRWKKGKKPKKLCLWTKKKNCPPISLYFQKITQEKENQVLDNAYLDTTPREFFNQKYIIKKVDVR